MSRAQRAWGSCVLPILQKPYPAKTAKALWPAEQVDKRGQCDTRSRARSASTSAERPPIRLFCRLTTHTHWHFTQINIKLDIRTNRTSIRARNIKPLSCIVGVLHLIYILSTKELPSYPLSNVNNNLRTPLFLLRTDTKMHIRTLNSVYLNLKCL